MWIFDIETYPDIFCVWFKNGEQERYYEISTERNDLFELLEFLRYLTNTKSTLIGFNNVSFDYPVLHYIIQNKCADPYLIYKEAQRIIDTPFKRRWYTRIRYPYINQIDLLLINHFDNLNRMTSLKVLEINMGMDNVRDLPFKPGVTVGKENFYDLAMYCLHDVNATKLFYERCNSLIEMRTSLGKVFRGDFTNMSNTLIGSTICENLLEEGGVILRDGYNKRQTPREYIELSNCILPYIHGRFTRPEFIKLYDRIMSSTITKTKGAFEDLSANVCGCEYVMGLGGLHMSIDPTIIKSDADNIIIDVDVASMYPSIAISNNLYPEHLGVEFCKSYHDIIKKRREYPKGTPENAGLKEAANATYGNSNQKHSCFYDPQYTMTTTISGQLSLLLLVQELIKVPFLKMIQANTDGITFLVSRKYVDNVKTICHNWETLTGLVLEEATYKSMYIRDVNNYIAEYY